MIKYSTLKTTREESNKKDHQAKVLVVDDTELNRDLLSRRLQRQGHKVIEAVNGQDALAKMGEHDFDLILLDIMMPVMDGYQVLEQVKKDDDFRHIPIIVVSAITEIESVIRCIKLGAEDFLSKPFNAVLLKARVNACLEKKCLRDLEKKHLSAIEQEKKKVDGLIHVLFPSFIADELKTTGEVKSKRYENVAVMFCDIVGFTSFCNDNAPETVVSHLQEFVEVFEKISKKHGVEKIKTIGDAYMCASGLIEPLEKPVINCVRCALEMIEQTRGLPVDWQVRIGIHVGPLIAGVVGGYRYSFDIWGDTVNTASRMESNGSPSEVYLSEMAWNQVSDIVQGESKGLIPVKGKGDLEVYSVKSIH
jgi:adenylate cyclase